MIFAINNYISRDTIIHHVILYESNRYKDFIQPKNILDFFSHINDLYDSVTENSKKNLTSSEFKTIKKISYKKLNTLYTDTKIEPSSYCPICYENFKASSSVTVLNCKHNFHTKCIKNWLLNESTECPICKTEAVS